MHSDLSKASSTQVDSSSSPVDIAIQPTWLQVLSVLVVGQIILTPILVGLKGDVRFSWQMYSHPIQYRIRYSRPSKAAQASDPLALIAPAPEVLTEQYRHLTAGHQHLYNYSAKALQSELQSFLNHRASELNTPFVATLSYREIGSEQWIRVELRSKASGSSKRASSIE